MCQHMHELTADNYMVMTANRYLFMFIMLDSLIHFVSPPLNRINIGSYLLGDSLDDLDDVKILEIEITELIMESYDSFNYLRRLIRLQLSDLARQMATRVYGDIF